MAMWFMCDPMFPQLFQRFFAAKSERALSRMMLLYPLVCTIVFFPPIAVGVLGHLSFPDLAGKQADRVLPMVINIVSGDFMAAMVTTAGLAALMSTMDSQLLTLSSVFTHDILPCFRKGIAVTSGHGRIFVAVLSLAGLALALRPPATILEIATETFTGLAVLFPTVLFGLYWKRVYPAAAMLSIAAGEAALIGFHFKWASPAPFLPVIWVMAITFGSYFGVHGALALSEGRRGILRPRWLTDRCFWMLAGVFGLAMDFWAWERMQPVLLGIPMWVAYFILLSALQTAAMAYLIRRGPDRH
jgi:solute:Na+ symporter, SSS family